MLSLLDVDKLLHFGPRRFLACLAVGLSVLFLGLFIALGVLIDGSAVATPSLLLVSLGYGLVMTAVVGRPIWRRRRPPAGK